MTGTRWKETGGEACDLLVAWCGVDAAARVGDIRGACVASVWGVPAGVAVLCSLRDSEVLVTWEETNA